MNHRLSNALLLALAPLLPGVAVGGEAASANYRLIGSAPAGTSAVAVSPLHRIYVVGGSGQAVGISASPNASVVAGGTSLSLPTERLFQNGCEG